MESAAPAEGRPFIRHCADIENVDMIGAADHVVVTEFQHDLFSHSQTEFYNTVRQHVNRHREHGRRHLQARVRRRHDDAPFRMGWATFDIGESELVSRAIGDSRGQCTARALRAIRLPHLAS